MKTPVSPIRWILATGAMLIAVNLPLASAGNITSNNSVPIGGSLGGNAAGGLLTAPSGTAPGSLINSNDGQTFESQLMSNLTFSAGG